MINKFIRIKGRPGIWKIVKPVNYTIDNYFVYSVANSLFETIDLKDITHMSQYREDIERNTNGLT